MTTSTQQSAIGAVTWKRLPPDKYYGGYTSITLPNGDQWAIARAGDDVDEILHALLAKLDEIPATEVRQ